MAKPHNFEARNFTHPINCDLCKELIWGAVKSGFSCKGNLDNRLYRIFVFLFDVQSVESMSIRSVLILRSQVLINLFKDRNLTYYLDCKPTKTGDFV